MVQVLIRQPPVYSMPGIRGLRTVSGNSVINPLYGRRRRRVPFVPLTEEQKQAQLEAAERSTARFLEAMNARFAQNGQRALEKLVDREARVAVEGDTDLNHDNLEGGE